MPERKGVVGDVWSQVTFAQQKRPRKKAGVFFI
jgi:hypothetical protein